MKIDFTFSDTIAGYVSSYSPQENYFTLHTSDEKEYTIGLKANTYAIYTNNLSEDRRDATKNIPKLLSQPGQFVYAYGTFYPLNLDNESTKFEAQMLTFSGDGPNVFCHEESNWWINQSRSIANSFLKWQFDYPNKEIDYHNYRTILNFTGEKKGGGTLQECDTISRLVYGFSVTYMMTGEEGFLEASEKGTRYLRDQLRFYDQDEDVVYWYHGIKIQGDKVLNLLTSEFGDDYYSIPIYEQIYALVGQTMTYRLTGDQQIKWDIEKTVEIFEKFKDQDKGGYFSHIDPITFNPRDDSLGHNRARKNWNSIGDHIPAYLVNLYLATGNPKYADMIEYTADLIVKHFPDFANSPFINEKFHEDWSKDQEWLWQQNRAVIGHNLKVVWTLMRTNSLKQKDDYLSLARKIAELMPSAGGDQQRGGWYDMVDRLIKPDGKHYRFSWHDRKVWWQQEQGILAYLILYGILGDETYLKIARESAAFYNAFFLDHDEGGIYFQTLASGIPFMKDEARFKGSHSMSGYHSMELCFLAAVYTNLLIKKEPMTFYFKPYPGAFPDNILGVAPDILPKGSIYIEACWIDNCPHTDFNKDDLTVKLPVSDQRKTVKVKIAPTFSAKTGKTKA